MRHATTTELHRVLLALNYLSSRLFVFYSHVLTVKYRKRPESLPACIVEVSVLRQGYFAKRQTQNVIFERIKLVYMYEVMSI